MTRLGISGFGPMLISQQEREMDFIDFPFNISKT